MNGSSFIFLEEVTNEREVFGINEKGALEVSARDHIGVEDPGQNERLCCGNCLTEFPVPRTVKIAFVDPY